MKLIIDIPEERLDSIKHFGIKQNEVSMLERALISGTPLPKEHGRLIDADKTISKICGSSCGCYLEECGHDKHCFSVARIESAPTIIEAERGE